MYEMYSVFLLLCNGPLVLCTALLDRDCRFFYKAEKALYFLLLDYYYASHLCATNFLGFTLRERTQKVEQIVRSRKFDAAIANKGVRMRSWPSVFSTFCGRTKFRGALLCPTFMIFALFVIHCYSDVLTDFKGNLATLKLWSVICSCSFRVSH